ncbi:DUF2958 domain-containing protein [Candidatus Micrarchaeota archaeon]|nr:DUF2958 domain-containing protein [Candidatus Micrarchaeota archaeon]
MKLMTVELERRFAEVGQQDSKRYDALVIAKYFHPRSEWTWWATEYNAADRVFFGYVRGFEEEWGYFSLDEMESVRDQLGVGVERDLYFREQTLRKALGMDEDSDP